MKVHTNESQLSEQKTSYFIFHIDFSRFDLFCTDVKSVTKLMAGSPDILSLNCSEKQRFQAMGCIQDLMSDMLQLCLLRVSVPDDLTFIHVLILFLMFTVLHI